MKKRLNIIIATDSFKGSISAIKLSEVLTKQIVESGFPVNIQQVPLADGGEGSLDAISKVQDYKVIEVDVFDPLFRKIKANYLFNPKRNIAFTELAQSSGFNLVKDKPDIMNSSTYGTGQLIKHALENGARKIVLFIGGSATNDAGLGILEACGFAFFDNRGEKIRPLPKNMEQINYIDRAGSLFFEYQPILLLAADVSNPFYGLNGAAHVYARQKGATDNEICNLNMGLRHIAKLIKMETSVDLQEIKGAGAAGGVGGGLVALAEGHIVSGADIIFTLLQLKNKINDADIIISGEGKIDSQSLNDKLLYKLSKLASENNKKVWAVCGYFDGDEKLMKRMNIEKVFSLAKSKEDIERSIVEPVKYLKAVAKEIILELKLRQNFIS